jgi:hypothetical protein
VHAAPSHHVTVVELVRNLDRYLAPPPDQLILPG